VGVGGRVVSVGARVGSAVAVGGGAVASGVSSALLRHAARRITSQTANQIAHRPDRTCFIDACSLLVIVAPIFPPMHSWGNRGFLLHVPGTDVLESEPRVKGGAPNAFKVPGMPVDLALLG
jgi:hypothetical protein